MSGTIVVVGSLNMDMVVRVPRHPGPGETILGEDFNTFPGGKGANQAVAAARLGAAVKMIGRLGADAFGDALLETLQRDGVDISQVLRHPGVKTGVAMISVDADGQNSIVVAPGANARLTAEDISAAESVFTDAAVVVLQLEIPLPAVKRAAELGKKYGAKVVLNPAPAQPLEDSLAKLVDYIIPNQSELAILINSFQEGSVERAAARLKDKGFQKVVVTLGENGAFFLEGDRNLYLPTFPVTVVDTTAAGDAFVGAFSVALSEGISIEKAILWGNAAGALAVTRPGAQPSLPAREEVERLLAQGRF